MHSEACCFICLGFKHSLICPLCFEKCSGGRRDLRAQQKLREQLAEELEANLTAQVQCSRSCLCNEQRQSSVPSSGTCSLVQELQNNQLTRLAALKESLAAARARTHAAKRLAEEGEQPSRGRERSWLLALLLASLLNINHCLQLT